MPTALRGAPGRSGAVLGALETLLLLSFPFAFLYLKFLAFKTRKGRSFGLVLDRARTPTGKIPHSAPHPPSHSRSLFLEEGWGPSSRGQPAGVPGAWARFSWSQCPARSGKPPALHLGCAKATLRSCSWRKPPLQVFKTRTQFLLPCRKMGGWRTRQAAGGGLCLELGVCRKPSRSAG